MDLTAELETRQRVARAASALQATLYERAELIGAPPVALDQDLDALLLVAVGASDSARPDPAVSASKYRDWLLDWLPRAQKAVHLAQATVGEIAAGRYDEDLRLALGPDGLMALLDSEHRRGQETGPISPDLGL